MVPSPRGRPSLRVLLIDNYDSFVYNLAQYLGALGATPVVVRNDVAVEELEELRTDALVVSPGPGRPEDAGCSVKAIQGFAGKIPVLGVCLGHQAIGVAFGGSVGRAERVMHGKTSLIFHDNEEVFAGLLNPFEATRYHSLVVQADSVPPEVKVTARTSDGVIMGIRHRRYPVAGVQFHPESVLTGEGMRLVDNFLRSAARRPVG
jgi:anthranilate synthase/aminodeoxychorismate synthase-like glutamine amidotransferase